jgi:hypothetical protein
MYATSRKVAGARPDEMNVFNLPNPSGSTRPWGLLSLSTTRGKIMFLGSRARPVSKADNFTAISVLIV